MLQVLFEAEKSFRYLRYFFTINTQLFWVRVKDDLAQHPALTDDNIGYPGKMLEHTVTAIMPFSSGLQLSDFTYCFLLVFIMCWKDCSLCLTVLWVWGGLYLLIGIAILCLASRPHHGKKFHSLALFVSSESDERLFHLMPLLWFHTHPLLGTPKRHIFGSDGEWTHKNQKKKMQKVGVLNQGVS